MSATVTTTLLKLKSSNVESGAGEANDAARDAARSKEAKFAIKDRTAQPHARDNVELHRARYRNDKLPLDASTHRAHYAAVQAAEDWHATHVPLDSMPVSRFHMHVAAQRTIYRTQVALMDRMYNSMGKCEGSWDGYTMMFRNGWSSGDKRKPVTPEFSAFAEHVYCPIIWALLFGPAWRELRKHWSTFKSCTIRVCENTVFYGDSVFHMHVDGKIGVLEPKNYTQRHMSRLLFSIVTEAIDPATPDPRAPEFGTTVYPIWQPKIGFRNNHEFHEYMHSLYLDRGLENDGLARPHYEIPEDLVYRAQTGEVLFHTTHVERNGPAQAIHSEPNPNPVRHLYVFDWNNVIDKEARTATEVPHDDVIDSMRALEDVHADAYRERLQHVIAVATDMLPKADEFQGGRNAVQSTIDALQEELSTLSEHAQ